MEIVPTPPSGTLIPPPEVRGQLRIGWANSKDALMRSRPFSGLVNDWNYEQQKELDALLPDPLDIG